MVVQPDGKILAGGYFASFDGGPAPYLIRLNADGSRDNTFSQTGTGLNYSVESVVVQPDGKILAGGEFTSYNGQPYAFTARLLGGVGAGFSATPDPVGFGEQQTGSTSGTLTVTVTNTGSAPLTFAAGAVTLGGDQPGQFSLGEDTCAGGSVPAAGTCTVKVRFAPTSTGVKTATLRFASNAAGSPHVVALTGTGTTPGFSATPDPVGFGEQQTGSTSGTLTVTVTNTGSAPLTFAAGAVTLGGDQPGQFSLGEDTCAGGSVPAAGTCTVKVRFAPTSTGVKTATLRFASNAAGSPHVVALTGTGTTPVTPPPPPQPQTVGAVVKKLKPKKKASLPRTTQQGAALTWKTATKKVCTVKGSKVTAKRKGTCKLKATAPAITDFLAYTGSAKIKVK
mgnify:FL=1